MVQARFDNNTKTRPVKREVPSADAEPEDDDDDVVMHVSVPAKKPEPGKFCAYENVEKERH